MKHIVRSFSVGLIAAGIVTLLVFYTFGEPTTEEVAYSTEELITLIEEDGYRVITEEDYISYTVTHAQRNKETEETTTAAEPDEAKSESEEEPSTEDPAIEEEEAVEDEKVEVEEEKEEVVEEEVEEETATTVIIDIPSGMASLDVSRLLETENVVSDAEEFNEYLLQNGYSQRVQLGKHELTTDMSHFEVAEALSN